MTAAILAYLRKLRWFISTLDFKTMAIDTTLIALILLLSYRLGGPG